MRSFNFTDENESVQIHYNGDFSGNAKVCHSDFNTGRILELELPCQALVNFSANATIDLVVGVVEQLYVER